MIIYKATNLTNKKVYIGKTKYTLEYRKGEHIYFAMKSPQQSYFYYALRKWGQKNFIWETIDSAITNEEASEKEIYWISYYRNMEPGVYNLTRGGEGIVGYKQSEELIRRRVESRKWYKHSEETREKIRKKRIGKNHTEESKKKMSETRKGHAYNPFTEETRDKIRKTLLGRTLPEGVKQKIRATLIENPPFKGKTHNEEAKQKIRESNKRRVITDEYRKRCSEGHKLSHKKKALEKLVKVLNIVMYGLGEIYIPYAVNGKVKPVEVIK